MSAEGSIVLDVDTTAQKFPCQNSFRLASSALRRPLSDHPLTMLHGTHTVSHGKPNVTLHDALSQAYPAHGASSSMQSARCASSSARGSAAWLPIACEYGSLVALQPHSARIMHREVVFDEERGHVGPAHDVAAPQQLKKAHSLIVDRRGGRCGLLYASSCKPAHAVWRHASQWTLRERQEGML